MHTNPFLVACTTTIALFFGSNMANAAEIKVMSGGPSAALLKELGPQFERETGHRIVAHFAGTAVIKREINAGEPFDLVVTDAPTVNDWVKQGKVVAASRTAVSHTGLGVGVRAGSAKPDVSSVDAARRTLLQAQSVGHGSESASATSFKILLERLGITEQMQPKLRPMGLGMPYKSVAAGEVEIIVANVPGILAAPGVELAGSFPPELQTYINFAAGVSSTAKAPETAQALLKFLTSLAHTTVFKAKGMEPGASR